MSAKGLLKGKTFAWADSNLALFGSDTEKQVKKSSAQTEPAWKNAGAKPGVKVWRIEKFKVMDWPEESYGQFYDGDSYIILNTYKDKDTDAFFHDVHFWIGEHSSQDEYGTAAYKTVELDTFLDDVPVQHRECQKHESDLFKSYFPKGLTTLSGGCATGFRSVTAEHYQPRLLHFCREKGRNVTVREIPRCPTLINDGDVYILDLGRILYQYNGSQASALEKSKAMQYVSDLKNQRCGDSTSEVLEAESTKKTDIFWQKLDQPADACDPDDDGIPDKKLLRVNTDTGKIDEVKKGSFRRADLKSDDVFICDNGDAVFVWVGGNASPCEKKNGFPYAHNYLQGSGHPWRSITVVKEGQKCAAFYSALAA